MACPSCGQPVNDEDRYCAQCGHRLNTEDKKMNRLWLLPAITAFAFIITFTSYFLYQHQKTVDAMNFFDKGERLSLDGDYTSAQAAFQKALEHRSKFQAAQKNQNITGLAIKIDDKIQEAKALKKDENYQESLNKLQEAENGLIQTKGKVANHLNERIKELRDKVSIAQINVKLKQADTLTELKALYNQSQNLTTDKGKEVAKTVKDKIVTIAKQQATSYLKEQRYESAQTVLDKSLALFPDNKNLLSLQKTVKSKKESYLKAQEQRLQEALTAAEKERKHNENEAVEVANVNLKVNKNGDMTVQGTVKSTATVSIHSVNVYYTIKGKNGNVINKGSCYATPYKIYPDEQGTFKNTHYNDSKKANKTKKQHYQVSVSKVQWYLD
ncbi:zinc-ribbon domain-containing protein [Tuberibacillus sp. Marseille-P3662]|uniref:zinc-ribbon domain-containing protein n=1 Tax=Tuberibacillus sp. Marseille-P3662 TaxID=1965358 RepID=UPI000A1C8945|nr:zinc-ribbon domain-containing protein [Tuberibacillus sp. Marseille-P3662]